MMINLFREGSKRGVGLVLGYSRPLYRTGERLTLLQVRAEFKFALLRLSDSVEE